MKERPILFSGPLVRAILEGRKTQTRRLVKPQPDGQPIVDASDGAWYVDGGMWCRRCPFGAPGDRLWVRESFCPRYFDNGAPAFAADWTGESADCVSKPKWTPSIHMPRALSRIDLEVTAVRVERLQDITEEDAAAEGVHPMPRPPRSGGPSHRCSFEVLWDEINGYRAAWASNPWVWVVEFRRIMP